MDLRHLAGAPLAAAALLACSSGYSIPSNAYPGGGGGAAGGGNGNYGGGGGGATSAGSSGGSSGGYTTGGSSGGTGTTTAGSSTTGSSTSGTTTGGSSGGTTTGGSANQLFGPLAFTVASAGQFVPIDSPDGGPSQVEFDLASFVLNCPGGSSAQAGSLLVLNLYSGSPDVPLMSGTYQVRPASSGLAYATATLTQNDGLGNTSVVATGESGQMTWTTSFNGVASGTLSINMSSNSGTSFLSGTFLAPFCGSF